MVLQGFEDSALTILTTGRIQGFALSSLYAPIPRSTFLGSSSRRKAAINPNSGSSGAWGTTFASKAVAAIGSRCEDICVSRVCEEVEIEVEEVSGLRTGESGMITAACLNTSTFTFHRPTRG
jgi:hypothetical protein